jgi:threonine dehydratase
MPALDLPSFDDIREAQRRIAAHCHRTPVVTSRTLDELTGTEVFLKCENLQRGGAFKVRGALNAVLGLTDEQAARGVAAHSSGNHAACLALAASVRGIPCVVVMPRGAPRAKVDAVRSYGGRVVECEPTLAAREKVLAEVLADTGATEIHPYDDPRVIAGAGTACLELLEEIPDLGLVIAPVSGGGLLSGTAIAAHGCDTGVEVWGAEPTGADDAHRSLVAGRRVAGSAGHTIADGLLAELSDRTFLALRAHVHDIVTVTDDEIIEAMRFLFERTKLVVEPSGATALAGLWKRPGPLPERAGVIISGGNLDLGSLPF